MTDPMTLPGHFASDVIRANVARLMDAYAADILERGTVLMNTLPLLHNCWRCVDVYKAEQATPNGGNVVRPTGAVQAREEIGRIPVRRDDGALGGKVGRDRHSANVRLREMRTNGNADFGLIVWPT